MRRSLALLLCLSACAHAGPAPAASPARAASAGAQSGAGVPSLISRAELTGVWVEYWALGGRADTQRYAFFADGRFGWRASDAGGAPIARRWGRFALEPRAHETALVLAVEGHEERFGCEGTATRRILHDPPLADQLVLGDCPPNEEAKALDPNYRCLGFAGRAFWRKDAAAEDEAAFVPQVTK